MNEREFFKTGADEEKALAEMSKFERFRVFEVSRRCRIAKCGNEPFHVVAVVDKAGELHVTSACDLHVRAVREACEIACVPEGPT